MDKTYQQVLKKLHFDMHTPEYIEDVGGELDVQRYVEGVKATGAQSVTLFARCAYDFTYFPTEIGFPHPNMVREDIFGELCSALRKEGIDVTAYMTASGLAEQAVVKHHREDWLAKSKEGEVYNLLGEPNAHVETCVTSPFYEEEMIPLMVECAKKYDINAIWIDGVYHALDMPCYCERCRSEFLKDVPQAKGKVDSAPFYRWKVDKVWDYLNKAALALEKVKPGCTTGADTLGCPHWSIPEPEQVGFITFDPPTPNLPVSISMNLAATAWRGKTLDMNIQRMRNWQDFNSRSNEMLMTEAAVCVSMNCMLIAGDLIRPKDINPNLESMKQIKTMFDFGEQIYHKVKDVPVHANIAILSSPEQIRGNGSKWPVNYDVIDSCYQMILSAGLCAHILFDDDLKENIHKYDCLIVPEQSYIGTHAAKAIKEYVEQGGHVIVTGMVPKAVDPYELDEMADSALMEEICGVKVEGFLEEPLSYIKTTEGEAIEYWNEDYHPEIAIGGKAQLTAVTTAKVEAYLYAPAQAYQIGARPIGEKTSAPAISVNQMGKGKVTFVSQPICKDYDVLGNFLGKRILQGIIRKNTAPYGILSGASNAQLVIAKNEDTVCVSTIVFHNDLRAKTTRVADQVGKIADLVVTLEETRTPKSVTSVLGNPVDVVAKNGKITISFSPVKIYAGVVLQF
ncbi:MAG: beta-galactosidase trimerization domain-containing protein [Eubacteriales bacterium]